MGHILLKGIKTYFPVGLAPFAFHWKCINQVTGKVNLFFSGEHIQTCPLDSKTCQKRQLLEIAILLRALPLFSGAQIG